MIRRPASCFGSNPIEAQPGKVEVVNEGTDRPNWIVPIDPILQTLGKQRRLLAIDPLNEAPHLIPPQIAAESYSANQIIWCVFTQARSEHDWSSHAADAFG
jgi:hypothetical protein